MNGRLEVHRSEVRLEAVFARASGVADMELQADLARHLCVLIGGYMETGIVALLLDYAVRRSSPEVQRFVETELDHWTNPNVEKICQLLGRFDPEWDAVTRAFVVDARKEAVNSVMALRHKVAHGEPATTSLGQVARYYSSIKETVGFIANILVPV